MKKDMEEVGIVAGTAVGVVGNKEASAGTGTGTGTGTGGRERGG